MVSGCNFFLYFRGTVADYEETETRCSVGVWVDSGASRNPALKGLAANVMCMYVCDSIKVEWVSLLSKSCNSRYKTLRSALSADALAVIAVNSSPAGDLIIETSCESVYSPSFMARSVKFCEAWALTNLIICSCVKITTAAIGWEKCSTPARLVISWVLSRNRRKMGNGAQNFDRESRIFQELVGDARSSQIGTIF